MAFLKHINREISWLHFNGRVLQEAADKTNPLIERIKFLGIFSNNRDEFFRVRVATIKRMISFGKKSPEMDFNPKKLLHKIDEIVSDQEKTFNKVYQDLVKDLASQGITIMDEKDLSAKQGDVVRQYFREHVRSFLFPIMVRYFKKWDSLRDRSIYLAVILKSSLLPSKVEYAIIEVPTRNLSRFFILPDKGNKKYLILLDDIIRYCLKDIFAVSGFDVFEAYTIKFTRDAELDIDNDISRSFLQSIAKSLKKRKYGDPVRFVYDQEMPQELLKILIKKLRITENDNVRGGSRYHNFKDFVGFPSFGINRFCYPSQIPLEHPGITPNTSILEAVLQKDIMLHFPYQSFQYIIDLLREASIDPKVSLIKMTIYRAAQHSSVINALINAARNGKSVSVYMELQARFDEEANIQWSEKMQEEGVQIIPTIPGYKVHSKLILISRVEKGKQVLYANIGTGNFNEETARIYSDESLLTANQAICQEVADVFHLFESNFKSFKFKHLIVSPFNMRSHFLKLIDREVSNSRKGKDAWVIIKLNNLVDEIIVRKLYKASQAGVKIRMIVRGICVLIPGIPGLSDNIEAISIVDRYLEHSRIIVFCNGGKEEYFITSADWMVRNFDYRIEVATPVYDEQIKNELRDMLNLQLWDNSRARIISEKCPNRYRKTSKKDPIRSQNAIYKYLKDLT